MNELTVSQESTLTLYFSTKIFIIVGWLHIAAIWIGCNPSPYNNYVYDMYKQV